MSLRISADDQCLFCATSSRAYRVKEEGGGSAGELEILWSSCLECGFTVPTSRHDASQVYGDLPRATASLDEGEPLLILPSEAVVYFYPATPEQLLNACYAAGFGGIHFELLGDELVAGEYLKRWRENREGRTWIRSTSPIVIAYVRLKHPELLPYLASIPTPAVALARYLRARSPEAEIVSVGLVPPGGTDEDRERMTFLTFRGLREVLESRGVDPVEEPLTLSTFPPERRRHLSVAGGLPLDMLKGEARTSREFRTIRNLRRLASIASRVEDPAARLGFIDVLPFQGTLDHPGLGPEAELLWRRQIAELAELPRASEPVVDESVEVDLSLLHDASPSSLPRVEAHDVLATLDRLEMSGRDVLEADDRRLLTCPYRLADEHADAIEDARHDSLTGLYSPGAFRQRMEEEVARANRAESGLALLRIEVDGRAEIASEHGNPVAEAALRRTAATVANSVRRSDVCARLTDDELAVILANPSPDGISRVADKIRARVERLRIPAGEEGVDLTASIGVAYHSGETRSVLTREDLLAEAEASLYIAKARGGNGHYPIMTEELTQNGS